MGTLLGTAYEVGNKEGVVSRRPDGAVKIEEGLFVKQTSPTEVGVADGDIPFGVMAQQEAIACGVCISGLKVRVQLNDAIEPAINEPVYVDAATNKATNDDNGGANKGTAAIFTGVFGTDGRSDNTTVKSTTVRWAEINMPNGL